MLEQLLSENLKSSVDRVITLRQLPQEDSAEDIKKIYKHDILPILLKLRYQNRQEKDSTEQQCKKFQELYEKLFKMREAYDSLYFMTSCLNADADDMKQNVSSSKTLDKVSPDSNGLSQESKSSGLGSELEESLFDVKNVENYDHETRMNMLAEEETKRKELEVRLAELNEQYKKVESVYYQGADKLNRVKPYIKQLLDKSVMEDEVDESTVMVDTS